MNKAKSRALEHLMSARDTKENLRKERSYWNARMGKKNVKVKSRPSGEGNYTQTYYIKKGTESRKSVSPKTFGL